MYRDEAYPPAAPEPARDANPFHHAAALVAKMDVHELEAIGRLVLERLGEFYPREPAKQIPKPRKALK